MQEVSAVGTLPFETEGLKHYRTTTGLPRYLPCYASFISLLLNLGLSNCHLFQPYEPAIMKESAFSPIAHQEQPITTFLNPDHLQLLWVLKFSLLEKKKQLICHFLELWFPCLSRNNFIDFTAAYLDLHLCKNKARKLTLGVEYQVHKCVLSLHESPHLPRWTAVAINQTVWAGH